MGGAAKCKKVRICPNKNRTERALNRTEQKPNDSLSCRGLGGAVGTGVGQGLFPVGFTVDADVDVLKFGDSLAGEVAEHAVGVFGGNAGAAVNGEFDTAGVAVEVEVDFADGARGDDNFCRGVTELAEVGFGHADVFFHAAGDFAIRDAGVFVDYLDGRSVGVVDSGGVFGYLLFATKEPQTSQNGDGDTGNKADNCQHQTATLFVVDFIAGGDALRGGF